VAGVRGHPFDAADVGGDEVLFDARAVQAGPSDVAGTEVGPVDVADGTPVPVGAPVPAAAAGPAAAAAIAAASSPVAPAAAIRRRAALSRFLAASPGNSVRAGRPADDICFPFSLCVVDIQR